MRPSEIDRIPHTHTHTNYLKTQSQKSPTAFKHTLTMGSSQSSHANKHEFKNAKRSMPEGVRGRKSSAYNSKGVPLPRLRESAVSIESQELSNVIEGLHHDPTADETLHDDDIGLHVKEIAATEDKEANEVDTLSETESEFDEGE